MSFAIPWPLWGGPAVDLVEAGHFKRAREVAMRQLQANRTDAESLYVLSRAALSFGEGEQALAYAERAVAATPNEALYHACLARVLGWMVDDQPALKKYAFVRRIHRELDAALAINPKQEDALLLRAMFFQIAPAVVGGDRKQAEAVVTQLAAINPVRGAIGRAMLAERQGNAARRIAELQRAAHLDPHSYQVLAMLAEAYLAAGPEQRNAAEKTARDAIALDRSRAGAYQTLATVLAASKRLDELDTVLASAEQAIPDDLSAYYAAALRLHQDGTDLARAQRYLRKYLTQPVEGERPTHAEAHYLLSQVTRLAGMPDQAAVELEAALRLRPDWREARKELKKVR